MLGLLGGLGATSCELGDYERADNYLSEGGALAAMQGQYAEAESYQQEALQLARQLEVPVSICTSLGNLGDIALRQERDDRASEYLQEALALARQVGRQILLCEVLELWGELQLRPHVEQAEAAFREIRELASAGLPANEAAGWYGLARVALLRGQNEEAQALGQESMRIYSSISNHRAAEVETWLHKAFS